MLTQYQSYGRDAGKNRQRSREPRVTAAGVMLRLHVPAQLGWLLRCELYVGDADRQHAWNDVGEAFVVRQDEDGVKERNVRCFRL